MARFLHRVLMDSSRRTPRHRPMAATASHLSAASHPGAAEMFCDASSEAHSSGMVVWMIPLELLREVWCVPRRERSGVELRTIPASNSCVFPQVVADLCGGAGSFFAIPGIEGY